MATLAAFEGSIPEEGVQDVLGGLEEIGTTGVLSFESPAGSGTIKLVHGQIVNGESSDEQDRALEVLLSLRDDVSLRFQRPAAGASRAAPG